MNKWGTKNRSVGTKTINDGMDENSEVEFTDSEADGEFDEDDLECAECCNSNVVTFDSDKERDVFIYEHTDKNENWSDCELEPEERNDKLRAKQVVKNL